jgi:glycosyltransferase involved in cell wall biosynthesis
VPDLRSRKSVNSRMKKDHNAPPLVSVTIPIYNGAAYLEETIESIIAQTFEDWELIAVDDSSTDNSWSILERYALKDPRIKIFRHPRNRGHRASSNFAFSLAKGRYVARSDQDDISLPNRLERQADFLDNNPKVGLVAAGHYRLFLDGRRVPIRKERDPELVRWGFLFGNAYCHSTFMFRREYVSGSSPYKFAPSAYDYEICARLARSTQIRAIPDPLVCYRIHSTGLATTDKARMNTAALAISSREIRRLMRPKKLTRKQFCSLWRLGTGSGVEVHDLDFLPDLFQLLQRFQSDTGVADRDITKIWRSTIQKLLNRLPCVYWGPLFCADLIGASNCLLVNTRHRTFGALRRVARVAIKSMSKKSFEAH